MKKIAFIVAAASLFAFAPLAGRFGAVPSSVALVWMGVLLALFASAGTGSYSLSIGSGALGALANGVLGGASPLVAGAVLVGAAFAERTTRIRSRNGRAVHVLLALVGGAMAGSLSHAYSSAALPVLAVAAVVAAVLAALPLLVEADDPVAHALDTAADSVSGAAKSALTQGAELRRTSSEVPLDRATATRVKTTWQSLLKLAEARVRLERTRPVTLIVEGPPAPSAADQVLKMLDQKLAEHVQVLAKAYTAVDAVTAARIGIDDSALKTVDSMGDSLEEVSRALVEVRHP
jgi:MFS family permease